MTVYADLENVVQAHRPHGELTWGTTTPTSQGYRVEVACPCGVTFERWGLPWEAAEGGREPGSGAKKGLTRYNPGITLKESWTWRSSDTRSTWTKPTCGS